MFCFGLASILYVDCYTLLDLLNCSAVGQDSYSRGRDAWPFSSSQETAVCKSLQGGGELCLRSVVFGLLSRLKLILHIFLLGSCQSSSACECDCFADICCHYGVG